MLIRYFKLRNALRKVIKENDQLLRMLAESELEDLKFGYFNCTWREDGDQNWRGWIYNEEHNRYLFDDIGFESLVEYWDYQWQWEKSLVS